MWELMGDALADGLGAEIAAALALAITTLIGVIARQAVNLVRNYAEVIGLEISEKRAATIRNNLENGARAAVAALWDEIADRGWTPEIVARIGDLAIAHLQDGTEGSLAFHKPSPEKLRRMAGAATVKVQGEIGALGLPVLESSEGAPI